MFCCFFDNYSPSKMYSHRQIQKVIKSRRNVLCFYAKESAQQRCALGLHFDNYDPRDGCVPLHILLDEQVMALSLVEGKKLRKAYKKSQIGKEVIVIYAAPGCKGWFNMSFDLGKYAAIYSVK